MLVDLQHLTCLQKLRISSDIMQNGSSVPPSLQSLSIEGEWPAEGFKPTVGFSNMQQLTSLDVLDAPDSVASGKNVSVDLRCFCHLQNLSLMAC